MSCVYRVCVVCCVFRNVCVVCVVCVGRCACNAWFLLCACGASSAGLCVFHVSRVSCVLCASYCVLWVVWLVLVLCWVVLLLFLCAL